MARALSGVRGDHSYSYEKLEARAAHVRSCLQVAPAAPLDAVKLFEELDEVAIVRADGQAIPLYGGVEALAGSDGYARFNAERNVLEILASEATYDLLEARHPRAAYFVAHELGHCVLHTEQLVRLAKMPTVAQQAAFHRGRTPHQVFQDTEWQANAFASALLMPAAGLLEIEKRHGSIDENLIADRFAVSYEAAGYRLDLFRKRRLSLLKASSR